VPAYSAEALQVQQLYQPLQLGNVNKKLVKALGYTAIIGAVAGALLLTYVGENMPSSPPLLLAYTIYLGIRFCKTLLKKKDQRAKEKKQYHCIGFNRWFY